jgi:carbon storage regulator
MLVLSRKVGERIVLPESGVVLTVLSIRGGQIRLGISAPPEVAVYREELWRAKASLAGAKKKGESDA